MKTNKGVLDNWNVIRCPTEPNKFRLYGCWCGKSIVTSLVVGISDGVAETENSLYQLGEPVDSFYDILKRSRCNGDY